MADILARRFTAQIDEPFVVFIIGMRINRITAVSKWLPTMRAMGPMIKEMSLPFHHRRPAPSEITASTPRLIDSFPGPYQPSRVVGTHSK